MGHHTRNIYKDGELEETATCKKSLQVQTEGNRSVRRSVKYYNLDMILAIGYRVRSHIGLQFRTWATAILTEWLHFTPHRDAAVFTLIIRPQIYRLFAFS